MGSGSGYTCAIFHHLVSPNVEGQPNGKVVGIDHIPELVAYSLDNLRNDGLGNAIEANPPLIEVHASDGREGWPSGGPYNAIHVGAAAFPVPKPLIEQLASPGRMFIPVGDMDQRIVVIDKDENGKVVEKELFGVRVRSFGAYSHMYMLIDHIVLRSTYRSRIKMINSSTHTDGVTTSFLQTNVSQF